VEPVNSILRALPVLIASMKGMKLFAVLAVGGMVVNGRRGDKKKMVLR